MPSKADYENLIQSFTGETLSKVLYFNCDDEEGYPCYTYDRKPFHNVMWGVEFHMASGKKITLWWGHDYVIPLLSN